MPDSDLSSLIKSLASDLPADGTPITVAERMEHMRSYVVAEISKLLDNNVPLLMSVLYRIDVREADLLECLSNSPREALPEALAELVLVRQLEKMSLRRQHTGHPSRPRDASRSADHHRSA